MNSPRLACLVLSAALLSCSTGPQSAPDPVAVAAAAPDTELHRRSAPLMGTIWTIMVAGGDGAEVSASMDASFRELARLEGLISEWQSDSEVSALNRAAGAPVQVSPATFELLTASKAVAEETGGAFDPTFLALGDLWRIERGATVVPSDAQIQSALQHVGWHKMTLTSGRQVTMPASMAIGVGGIGKGFCADRVAQLLRERGHHNVLVDAGGDVVAAGTYQGKPWRVGVQDPAGTGIIAEVAVDNAAVMTSGGYEKYVEIDGVRYTHIIDPRTGRPTSGIPSVTVIAPRGDRADALATALFVMGPDDAKAFIEKTSGIEAMLVLEDGTTWSSPGAKGIVTETRAREREQHE